jgi:hypothetical protein
MQEPADRWAKLLQLVQLGSQLDVIDDFRFEPLGCLRVTRASRAAQADGRLDPWLPLPLAEGHSRL